MVGRKQRLKGKKKPKTNFVKDSMIGKIELRTFKVSHRFQGRNKL